jgi:hypothetical protein
MSKRTSVVVALSLGLCLWCGREWLTSVAIAEPQGKTKKTDSKKTDPKKSSTKKPAGSDPAAEDSKPAAKPTATKAGTKSAGRKTGAAKWADMVAVDDLVQDVNYALDGLGQNLKSQRDYDRFVKDIQSRGHLIAVLAEILRQHSDAGGWRPVAGEIQQKALEIAKAAESKGVKNYRTAQDAQKAIAGLMKAGPKSGAGDAGGGAPADWESLARLADVMKRVDAAYKRIRGANANSFAKDAKAIGHEAAILAVLSDLAPFYKADDKVFAEMSVAMRVAALETVEASKAGDFEAGQKSSTAINDSCNKCHQKYRLDQTKGFDF